MPRASWISLDTGLSYIRPTAGHGHHAQSLSLMVPWWPVFRRGTVARMMTQISLWCAPNFWWKRITFIQQCWRMSDKTSIFFALTSLVIWTSSENLSQLRWSKLHHILASSFLSSVFFILGNSRPLVDLHLYGQMDRQTGKQTDAGNDKTPSVKSVLSCCIQKTLPISNWG